MAIFAMVFAHVGLRMKGVDESLAEWIHLWHMPIFFILSGMVLNGSKWLGWNKFLKLVINRFKSLIIPFLIWGTLCNIWLFIVLRLFNLGGVKILI